MELLVVGLDGLSYNMLDRFDVELEYLDRVRDEGVSGDLASVDTPTTVPAWTSFATGKDPGTHGITNMVRQDPDYEIGPNRRCRDHAMLFDLLDDAVLVNAPGSVGRVPAGEDTHVVSAWMAEDRAEAVPDHMKDLDAYDDYVVSHDSTLRATPSRYLDHVIEISRARHAFAREAFERYEPRFGFVLFSTPDWAGHLLSNLSSEEKRARFYGDLLERVDAHTADLAATADNVLLVSDHGFEYKHTNVHPAEWLHDRGFFEEPSSSPTPADIAVGIAMGAAKRSDRIYALLRRIHNHILGMSWGSSLQTASRPDVDYGRSAAWHLRHGCVYVNDGRFDDPTVDDPAPVREAIHDGLAELTDPDGDPLFESVVLAEEAYTDPIDTVPDVIARPAEGVYPLRSWSPTGGVSSETSNFEHRHDGIVAGTGPAFESGSVVGMGIVDVLPTILAALGEPLPPDLDGAVRSDVLSVNVGVETMDADAVPDPRARSVDSDAEAGRQDTVEDRLADLGYLE
jgi:predicted AlkP superfamily phosphohydrolase/phosphomutase